MSEINMHDGSATPAADRVLVGQGPFTYEANANWVRRPAEFTWSEVSAVAVDSHDHVYVFNRGDHPVMIFDRDGSFLRSWGAGVFARAHGITIGPDDSVYCTDDLDHTVRKFTPEGELLLTLGTSGRPSDTGATSIDYRTIRYAGLPFYFPTNVALSPQGDIYVTDGYGNARVHKFSASGQLLLSWGAPGSDPGQFHVPHGIAVDKQGQVFVADRENSRIQIFSPDGEFLQEWTDIARPCQVAFDAAGHLFVAELGYRSGMWPGTTAPSPDATGGRVSVLDADGTLLARWGGGTNPTSTGDFFAPHDVRLDSRGDIYLSEVVMSAGGNRGLVSPDCHTLQKFVLQR
jgi:DNA-binding beta-propeller fold protein YncE